VSVPLIVLHSFGANRDSLTNDVAAGVYHVTKPIRPSNLLDTLTASFHGGCPTRKEGTPKPTLDASLATRIPLRILLAEDHPVNQKMTELMLSRLGYRVDVVSNGLEAVSAVKMGAYDLVLMDVQMPEMDGLEATQRIRKLSLSWPQPRIVAMTANASKHDRELCFAAGMNDFVSKPMRPEDLQSALVRSHTPPPEACADDCLSAETLATVKRNIGGSEEVLAQLLESYQAEAKSTLNDMENASAEHNLVKLRQKAHYLKGSSAMIGANSVASQCRQIEALSEENWHKVTGHLEALHTQLAQTQESAKVLLKK